MIDSFHSDTGDAPVEPKKARRRTSAGMSFTGTPKISEAVIA